MDAVEQFILDSLKKKLNSTQIAEELQKTLGVTKTGKQVHNKITLMRTRGVNIPPLRPQEKTSSVASKKVTSSVPKKSKPKTYKSVAKNVLLTPMGTYKVHKRVNGKNFQKIFKDLDTAKKYRDSLEASPVAQNPVVIETTKVKRPYHRKEPKISKIEMSSIFENNGKFVVIVSKDRGMLTELVNTILG